MQEAYIVAGYRSAVGKANRGGFKYLSPVDLAKEVIDHLLKSRLYSASQEFAAVFLGLL